MTLRINNKQNSGAQRRQGMTLMELMLVMALLVIVLAVAAPSLARFFRGRNLDSEAGRFLSLTRYGQSRAVSEGMPMVLWVDAQNGKYGLQADISYTGNNNAFANNAFANNAAAQNDTKAMEFSLDEKLQIEAEQPVVEKSSGQWWQSISSLGNNAPNSGLMNSGQNAVLSSLPQIRFEPDGSIDQTSPTRVLIRELQDSGGFWIAQSRTRLNYEIEPANLQTTRR